MDGVYYNQIVKEEVLNAMATDLGATDFNNFTGIEKFGADKLNEITQSLVSEGILISDDMCRCVKTDTGIIIMPGTIVFKSGAKKTISENMSIDAANGTVVYALNNIAAGTCTIETEGSFPDDAEADFIKLCSIDESGNVLDCRKIAQSKMELFSGGNHYEIINYSVLTAYDRPAIAATIQRTVWERYSYIYTSVGNVFMPKNELNFTSYEDWGDSFTTFSFREDGDNVLIEIVPSRGSSKDPLATRTGTIYLL